MLNTFASRFFGRFLRAPKMWLSFRLCAPSYFSRQNRSNKFQTKKFRRRIFYIQFKKQFFFFFTAIFGFIKPGFPPRFVTNVLPFAFRSNDMHTTMCTCIAFRHNISNTVFFSYYSNRTFHDEYGVQGVHPTCNQRRTVPYHIPRVYRRINEEECKKKQFFFFFNNYLRKNGYVSPRVNNIDYIYIYIFLNRFRNFGFHRSYDIIVTTNRRYRVIDVSDEIIKQILETNLFGTMAAEALLLPSPGQQHVLR